MERMGLNPVKVNPEKVKKDYIAMENERDALSNGYKKQIKEIKELEYLKDTLTQYMNIYYKEQNKEKTKNFNEL